MQNKSLCNHNEFCQHRLYEKCFEQRVRKISLQFPKSKVQCQKNFNLVNIKQCKSNIPTMAYQKYINNELQISQDENFVKNYYVSSQNTEKGYLNIIQTNENALKTNDAYVLSGIERNKFIQCEAQRRKSINNCRRRAITHYNQFFHKKQQNKKDLKIQTEKELKKLYLQIQQVANLIIYGRVSAAMDREKQMLLSKSYLTAGYLSEVKIKNPKNAINIIEEIRVLLQKQKLNFQEQRQILENNKSMSMSFSTDASGQDDSQSKISEVSLNASQIDQQEEFINKYCDLSSLQAKWKKQNLDEVKVLIRRVIARKILADAQRKMITNKNKQKQIDNKLLKDNPDLAKKIQERTQRQKREKAAQNKIQRTQKQVDQNAKTKNLQKKLSKTIQKNNLIEQNAISSKLASQQINIKLQWMKTGRFDPPGQLFDRTNNYSRIFQKKATDMQTGLEWKDTLSTFKTTINESKIQEKFKK